jgi:hypothetical protein
MQGRPDGIAIRLGIDMPPSLSTIMSVPRGLLASPAFAPSGRGSREPRAKSRKSRFRAVSKAEGAVANCATDRGPITTRSSSGAQAPREREFGG